MLEQQDLFSKLPEQERRDAIFSKCGRYRYVLSRHWDDSKPKLMLIGLNPSTANQEKDDRTIENIRRICQYNGYGGFFMLNLFAFITPYPEELGESSDPIGENDFYLSNMKDAADDVCFCWGNFGYDFIKDRIKIVEQMFDKPKCLGLNKNGSPRHPLYLPKEIEFVEYSKI